MEYKDYYKTLGVNKNASEKELKSAFRKLAREHHPDVNPDDPKAEARFKEVNEAYEVLGDPDKRHKYDHLGADWHRFQQHGGQPGDFNWGQWANSTGTGGGGGGGGPRVNVRYNNQDINDMFGGGGGGFSDFFSSVFGGGAGGGQRAGFNQRTQSQQGRDIEQEVEISLTEAYRGTTRLLNKDGRRLEVKIPAGAKTGTRVRMRGEGGRGVNGGEAGNLYLKVKVASDPRFERKEDNLQVAVSTDLYTAVLGGEVLVPTFSGEVKLKIPAGAQNGQKFRLRGKGMPKLNKKDVYGDMFAKLTIQLPTNLTPEQREHFEALRESSS